MKGRTIDRLNVRSSPKISATNRVGVLAKGASVEVARNANGWCELQLAAGGALVGTCYARAEWILLDVTPPRSRIPVHPKYQLGVNVLHSAEWAEEAFRRGCRAALIMDNSGSAYNLARAYPDSWVMLRRYHSVKLEPHRMADMLDVTNGPPNLIFTGANECDTYCYGTVEQIRERFEFDRGWAQIIHARNPASKVAIGTFSHGTPDWTNPAIVQAMRDTYIAFVNANRDWVYLDFHSYTKGKRFAHHPPNDAHMIGAEWFEMRYRSAYDRAGLHSEAICVSGEHGVEAGHGGFRWANYTHDQFREWCDWWMEQQRNTPTPLLCAALYTLSEHVGWQGYHMQGYLDVLTDLWRS